MFVGDAGETVIIHPISNLFRGDSAADTTSRKRGRHSREAIDDPGEFQVRSNETDEPPVTQGKQVPVLVARIRRSSSAVSSTRLAYRRILPQLSDVGESRPLAGLVNVRSLTDASPEADAAGAEWQPRGQPVATHLCLSRFLRRCMRRCSTSANLTVCTAT